MRDNFEEFLVFPNVHHTSVRTTSPSLGLRREEFSPLLLGCFDLLV